MQTYNKLVRDRIPELIEARGKSAEIRVLDAEEYGAMLRLKLQEEVGEFLAAPTPEEQVEELADLVEVIHAWLKSNNIPVDRLEEVRLKKKAERGGFDRKLLLVRVAEPTASPE